HANKRFRFLCACNDPLRIDDETGNALNAHMTGGGVFLSDELLVGIFREEVTDNIRVHTGLSGSIDQYVMRADVLAILEIAAEENIDHFVLAAGGTCPADQPVAVQRVWRFLDEVEAEIDADRRAVIADRVTHFLCALGAEFLFEIGLAIDTARRNGGVELEGAPDNADAFAAVNLKRLIEPFLADIAPGADCVGDDVELHLRPPSLRNWFG